MTIRELRENNLIVLECISGSKAYGLDLPTSDTDIRGVFILPKSAFYGLDYIPQVSDERNDVVFYELGRFIELLSKNNPNILELLATPAEMTLHKHPLMEQLDPAVFLSRKCKDTFGGYAFTQIKKARGLKKKIVNPVEKEKKTILEFCYIFHGQGAMAFPNWLKMKGLRQEHCGLVNIPHCKDVYALFYDAEATLGYKGVIRKKEATKVLLSSIPKKEEPLAHLYFNQDGYMSYCKDYREYWDWVDNRNEARYQNNREHGKNYDSKNMMHTFRLLDMAIEILRDGQVQVKRPNREELLAIRRGEWSYPTLLEKADEKMAELEKAYAESALPAEPDTGQIQSLLVRIRSAFYDADRDFQDS